MKEMINHIKLWNRWRKGCLNGKTYKFLVLLKLVGSPTLEFLKRNNDKDVIEILKFIMMNTVNFAQIVDRD